MSIAEPKGCSQTSPSRPRLGAGGDPRGSAAGPPAYDPLIDPSLARARREHVLDRLVADAKLTGREAERASAAVAPSG